MSAPLTDRQMHGLGAADAVALMSDGALTSEALVTACLEHIEEREPELGAWAFLDRDLALAQARAADERRARGRAAGPLNGIPVGIKDIIDTRDMPTENGTVLDSGRRPEADATLVRALREAGAVIMGKTVTAELAVYTPGKTVNPHDPSRTPGGSSSGSAAAVAAEMVPLAVGTQTNGSVIRPASYCGVVGYKPTFGHIPRVGVLTQSPILDQVGVFARSVGDAALLAQTLMVYDAGDRDVQPRRRPALAAATADPLKKARIAVVRSPAWDQADDDARQALIDFSHRRGETVRELILPAIFDEAYDIHRTIMETELARNYEPYYSRGADALSPMLRRMIERGRNRPAAEFTLAVEKLTPLHSAGSDIFQDVDAILTLAATGEAPQGLQSTGSPVFSTPWSLLGLPAVSLPLLRGASGMPVGVQLVAAYGDDDRLLRVARALEMEADQ